MARMMAEDDDLYRVVIIHHREFNDVTWYYGPYTSLKSAKTQMKRELTGWWVRNPVDGHVEILTASKDPFGFPELLWEKVSG